MIYRGNACGNAKLRSHFHILLEVPPMPLGGISDEELLKRLLATHTEAFVAVVAKELAEALEAKDLRIARDLRVGI